MRWKRVADGSYISRRAHPQWTARRQLRAGERQPSSKTKIQLSKGIRRRTMGATAEEICRQTFECVVEGGRRGHIPHWDPGIIWPGTSRWVAAVPEPENAGVAFRCVLQR